MTSATPPGRSSTSGSRLRVAARRPLTTFLILGFALAYALAFLWGLAYYGVIPGGGLAAALHIAPDELTGGAVVLSLFPAALLVTWATSGRVGVRSLFRRAFRWRVSPGWWLTVLLGLPALTVGLALLMGDQFRSINVPSFLASRCFCSSTSSSSTSGKRWRGPGCSRPGWRNATTGSSLPC